MIVFAAPNALVLVSRSREAQRHLLSVLASSREIADKIDEIAGVEGSGQREEERDERARTQEVTFEQ